MSGRFYEAAETKRFAVDAQARVGREQPAGCERQNSSGDEYCDHSTCEFAYKP